MELKKFKRFTFVWEWEYIPNQLDILPQLPIVWDEKGSNYRCIGIQPRWLFWHIFLQISWRRK